MSTALDGWLAAVSDPNDVVRPKRLVSLPARAKGYRAVAELLTRPPTDEALDEARAILGRPSIAPDGDPASELRTVLASATADAHGEPWLRAASDHAMCGSAEGSARAWACVASELVPDVYRATDLLVLATLAERAEWAQRHERSDLAAALRQQRRLFVMEHAALCLGVLARDLEACGPLMATAGRALAALLAAERG